jgi:hypothetical protein
VDTQIPVLARMHTKRRQAYASLGFDISRWGVTGRPRRVRPARHSHHDPINLPPMSSLHTTRCP